MKSVTARSPRIEALEARLLLSGMPACIGPVRVPEPAHGSVLIEARDCRVGRKADAGDAFADATAAALGSSGSLLIRGRLDTAKDVDVFSFVAPADGTVHADLSVMGRSRRGDLSVYDAAGHLLFRDTETWRTKAAVDFEVEAGATYFVRIDALNKAKGPYAARLKFTAAPAENTAPVAAVDAYEVDEDNVLAIRAAGDGVLANDTDADGDALSAALVRGPEHGALELAADGTFLYTPEADFSGTDTFIYRAGDGTDSSNLAMVTIAVNPLNDAPVARDDRFEIYEGETRLLAPAGALANDTDADGDALSLVVVDAPQHGTVTTDADGHLVYTPEAGFTGEDTLTYRAADGQAESNLATITISVLDSNHAPVAHDDAYTVVAGQTLGVFMPGVLANDVDADGDWLIAMVVGQPSHGTFSADPLGGFTYTPAAGFTGIDTFTYMAADQRAFSAPATVTITVLPAGGFVA